MNNKDTGGPVFPAPTTKPLENYYPGMTLRDYFAAKAMQGFISDPNWRVDMMRNSDPRMLPEETARAAYRQADAMLKARGA